MKHKSHESIFDNLYSVLLIASDLQESIHFRQPVHSHALNISTCLLMSVLPMYRKDLSITFSGQVSMHFQQAVHDSMSNWTNAVCVESFLSRVDIIF